MKFAGIAEEHTKMNAFKMKAGNKLIDMLEGISSNETFSISQQTPYTNAMKRLGQFFSSKDYVFLQKQCLRSMSQNQNGLDTTYGKRVVEFAKLCGLEGVQMVEAIIDVLQTHAVNILVHGHGTASN